MKYSSTFTLTALFLLIFMGFTPQSKSCDKTETVLDSIIYRGGGLYDIYIGLCIGGGVQGGVNGANGNTRSFAFNFFGGTGLAPTEYPLSVTSDTTGAVYNASLFGPFMGSQFAVAYLDPGTDYTCITSTALCGTVHADCKQYRFRVNAIPDSIRVLGMEGGGNPTAGCYPNPDMLIDLTSFPVVWAGFDGQVSGEGINLTWTTSMESNTNHLLVTRSSDGKTFEVLTEIQAKGVTKNLNDYSFFDPNPLLGTNMYQIVMVDNDGKQNSSEILRLNWDAPEHLTWKSVSPNPAHDYIDLSFLTGIQQDLSVKVAGVDGKALIQNTFKAEAGSNSLHLDLQEFASGIYMIQLSGPEGMIQKKILKF